MMMLTLSLLLVPCPVVAREARLPEGELPDRSVVQVIPGAGMMNSKVRPGLHRSTWQDLWSTPINVTVIDLRTFAGGMRALEAGSDHLSKTLRFEGADGRQYLFISLDKDPTRELSPNLRGTALENLMRSDAISINPVAELLMTPILDAAGLPHVQRRLIVLPYDRTALGQWFDEFAGLPGVIEEFPTGETASAPGFMGARRIAGTAIVLNELEQDNGNAVDARAYLVARLVDLLVGDGDRLPDQWSWAAYGDSGRRLWVPVPLRHYQAFSRRSGLVPLTPYLHHFGPGYPDIDNLSMSARKLDRRLLPALDRREWMAVTHELQLRLTDRVIADAVQQMPPAMYSLEGKRLEQELMSRRDHLAEASSELYRILAKVVDIHGSAMPEIVSVHRQPGGGIDIAMYRKDAETGKSMESPFFHRAFTPDETKEVRIHLDGGSDESLVDGPADSDAIVARFIGGSGAARFEDHTGERDVSGNRGVKHLNHVYGFTPDAIVETGRYTAIARHRPAEEERHDQNRPDTGSKLSAGVANMQLNYSPDYGILAGWGVMYEKYGFDADPYLYHGEVDGAVAYGEEFRHRFRLAGDIRTMTRNISLHLEAITNSIDNFSNYGLGNETHPVAPGMDEDDFKTSANVSTLSASLRYPQQFGQLYFWEAGIELKWITTNPEQGSFMDLNRAEFPNIDADFTSDLQLGFHYDSRVSGKELDITPRAGSERAEERRSGATSAALSGMTFDIVGRYYPERIDSRAAFGKLNGEFRAYVPLNESRYSRIVFRIGGQQNWGAYPYYEAAAIGGSNSIRGFDRNRFSGDASVYANTELRLYGGHGKILVPILFGPMLFVDTGRVFLDGESSSLWHTGIGAGIWIAFFEPRYSAHLAIARGLDAGRLTDGYGIYAQTGFSF